MEDNKQTKKTHYIPCYWTEAVDYIKSCGGYIHESIEFTTSREVKVNKSIERDSELMRIPNDVLINLARVEKTDLGMHLFQLLDSINSQELFNSKEDLLLSLFLACVDCNNDTRGEFRGIKLYLATLPTNSSFDNLPRRWKDDDLKYLPVSVKYRAIQERDGLHNDFIILKNAYENPKGSVASQKSTWIFPSEEKLDQMVAVVGTRAFHEYGEDGLDTLIPLLDLMNHKRGIKASSDVSYTRLQDGSIQVLTKHHLSYGSSPGITYGAKANRVLLLRYGFCIEENFEPDGSSNDTAEFGMPIIELKTGPKSYTYGNFVKLLERFTPNDPNKVDDSDTEGDFNSETNDKCCRMEEYQNTYESDAESEFEDENFDVYNEQVIYEEVNNDRDSTCDALSNMMVAIEKHMKSYALTGQDLEKVLELKDNSHKYYCALIMQSELHILQFYHMAASTIKRKLNGEKCLNLDCKNDLIQKQIEELANVFCLIRHQLE